MTSRRTLAPWVLCLGLGCGQAGTEPPKPSPAAPAAPAQTLYERLGGEKGISKVVDDLVVIVIADDKYKPAHKKHFQEGDVAALKQKLVDQIGEATGGPQKYTGKNMKDAHKDLEITDADFDALIANVVKALDKNKVPEADQRLILDTLEKMRKEIVEKPEG